MKRLVLAALLLLPVAASASPPVAVVPRIRIPCEDEICHYQHPPVEDRRWVPTAFQVGVAAAFMAETRRSDLLLSLSRRGGVCYLVLNCDDEKDLIRKCPGTRGALTYLAAYIHAFGVRDAGKRDTLLVVKDRFGRRLNRFDRGSVFQNWTFFPEPIAK
jgi:hypothetical protein